MSIEATMEEHGFRLAASCGGKASYTRWVDHQGKRAYVAITDIEDQGLPRSLDEPARIAVFDLRSGDELEPSRDVASLKSYLESLAE